MWVAVLALWAIDIYRYDHPAGDKEVVGGCYKGPTKDSEKVAAGQPKQPDNQTTQTTGMVLP